ncbi:MAG: hybrid sensor histidine kinase/response regulator [Candidatus Omnitrophica bacterium]|nr:hybrid sensor histidine kinase/response regulator [Candidatus Omnitrophota bacterium]
MMQDIRLEKILLIEDNDEDARFFEKLVKSCFCVRSPRQELQVIRAGTPREALEIIRTEVVDFIFLDLGLSEEAPVEIYLRIREVCPLTPIILLTDHYNIEKASEMIAKGAEDYILRSNMDKGVLERVIRYGLLRAETLRMKQEILSMVIHDMKTPISVTSEAIAFILDGMAGDINKEQRNFLTMARRNMRRLTEMVDNLRESAATELGKISLRKEKINITEMINEMCDGFFLPFKAKGLELDRALPGKDVYAQVDGEKLSHVLMNLIGNSLKYTERGSVEVSLIENVASIEFRVKDTGPGIPKDSLERVFVKFERTKEMIKAGKKGIGLGLAIAKGIVEAHNGKIWVTEGMRNGAEVVFTLPKG